MSRLRRNKYEIFYRILVAASEGAKKIELTRKAKVNYTQLNKYMKHLSNRDLIELRIDQHLGVTAKTTDEGYQLMRVYENIPEELKLYEKT